MRNKIAAFLCASLAASPAFALFLDADKAGEAAWGLPIHGGTLPFVLVAAAAVLYFLPILIVTLRGRARELPLVFVVDLLLAWTGIGWLIALFWATKPSDEIEAAVAAREAAADRRLTGDRRHSGY